MKKIIYTILLAELLLNSCSPKTYELAHIPINRETGKIEWTTNVRMDSIKKDEIYVRIIQWVNLKYPTGHIKTQDKSNGIINVGASGKYEYNGHPNRTMLYHLVFLIKDGNCQASITDITIRHHPLQKYYEVYKERDFQSVRQQEYFKSIDSYFNTFLMGIKNNFSVPSISEQKNSETKNRFKEEKISNIQTPVVELSPPSIYKKWKLVSINGDSTTLTATVTREYMKDGTYTFTKTIIGKKRNNTENSRGKFEISSDGKTITVDPDEGERYKARIILTNNSLEVIGNKSDSFYREDK